MPVFGNAYPYVWQVYPASGGPSDEVIALALADNVKLWAIMDNGQLSVSDEQAAGLLMTFEI